MEDESFLGISYGSWKKTCEIFLETVNNRSLKRSFSMYLQNYPFTQITIEDKQFIESNNFYNEYIRTGAIFFNESVWFRAKNFITKNSGGFRDAQLISPFMFLIQQALGVEIQKRYQEKRKSNSNLLALYSGNFKENKGLYKNEYQEFSKWNNFYADSYPYFIKTDLSDYFPNINIDRLFTIVNENCNNSFTPVQIKTIKDIFKYCGNGKFPLIQNSVASSFLATIIYLDKIDSTLGKFIESRTNIKNYKLIRYVDDLYIWLEPENETVINHEYNEIRSEYSSLLHKQGLTLNTKKTNLFKSEKINEQLKQAIYDDVIVGQENGVNNYIIKTNWTNNINNFISEISKNYFNNDLNKDKFEGLVNDCFKPDNMIEFTGEEVLKYIIYENISYLQDNIVINSLANLIIQAGVSFIYLSPQLLTSLIINTSNNLNKNKAIKAFLNQLFKRNRQDLINSYDIAISIYYLLNTHFKHYDLKEKIIKSNEPELYSYIINYCSSNFLLDFNQKSKNEYIDIINEDWKTYYLYFNFRIEEDKNSYMEAYAYFITYFDRITALLDQALFNRENINVRRFYREKNILKFYEETLNIKVEEYLIKNANKLRNQNPLVHSSSEMLDSDWSFNIKENIERLCELINRGIKVTYNAKKKGN